MAIRSRSTIRSTHVFVSGAAAPTNANANKSAEASASTPDRLVALGRALISVMGLSGVLYAIGFASLQARHSLLGISEKIAWSNADIATEGGRFFYQLAFVVANLLLPVSLPLAVATIVLAGAGQMLRFKALPAELTRVVDRGRPWWGAASIAAGLLVTLTLLETPAQAATWHDLLRAKSIPAFLQDEHQRSTYFAHIEVRALISVLIALGLYKLWPTGTAVLRIIIFAQWFTALAVVMLLPIAFGKLMSTFEYPRFEHPAANASDLFVLIGQSDKAWVVWDCTRRETRLLPNDDKTPVALGQRVDLLKGATK